MSSSTTRRDAVPFALVLGGIVALLVVAAGVLSLLGVFGPSSSSPPPRDSLVGRLLPAFSPAPPRVDGRGELAEPWRDGRATAILFFADFCGPCHHELSVLAAPLGDGRLGPVQVIGLDEDAERSVATAFVRAERLEIPVGWDENLAIADALVPEGLPAAVFVRADGRIADVSYGALTARSLSVGLSDAVSAQRGGS